MMLGTTWAGFHHLLAIEAQQMDVMTSLHTDRHVLLVYMLALGVEGVPQHLEPSKLGPWEWVSIVNPDVPLCPTIKHFLKTHQRVLMNSESMVGHVGTNPSRNETRSPEAVGHAPRRGAAVGGD